MFGAACCSSLDVTDSMPCECLLQAMVAFALLLIVEGFKGGPGLIPGGGAPSGL